MIVRNQAKTDIDIIIEEKQLAEISAAVGLQMVHLFHWVLKKIILMVKV